MAQQRTVSISLEEYTVGSAWLTRCLKEWFKLNRYHKHKLDIHFKNDLLFDGINEWCKKTCRGETGIFVKLLIKKHDEWDMHTEECATYFVRFEKASDATLFRLKWADRLNQ